MVCGFERQAYSGVGELVSNKMLKQVVKEKRCNKRIMLVKIVVSKEVTLIISAYEPKFG